MAEPYKVDADASLKTGEVIPVGVALPGYTVPPPAPAAAPAPPSASAHPPTGAAVLEDAKTEVAPEFCVPHSPGLNVLFVVGGVILLIAMIAAGVNAGDHGLRFWGSLATVLFRFWESVVHTGSGVAAVAIAAWMLGQRFGNLEFAIARMFVAFSAFLFVMQLQVPPGGFVGDFFRLVLAGLVYWTAVLLLFRKSPREASMVGIAHAAFWLFVKVGIALEAAMVAPAAVAAAAPAGVH